jgi:hypothetical protein
VCVCVCVCVFAFDLCVVFIVFVVFFMFILLPHHKSCESMKIGPHPWGQIISYGISSLWLPRIYSCFMISTINFENLENSPKIASNFDLLICLFFVALIHRFDVLGVNLQCHKFSSPNSSYFSRNRRFFIPISAQIDELLTQDFSKSPSRKKPVPHRLKPASIPAKFGPTRSTPSTASICSTRIARPDRIPRIASPASTPRQLAARSCTQHTHAH